MSSKAASAQQGSFYPGSAAVQAGGQSRLPGGRKGGRELFTPVRHYAQFALTCRRSFLFPSFLLVLPVSVVRRAPCTWGSAVRGAAVRWWQEGHTPPAACAQSARGSSGRSAMRHDADKNTGIAVFAVTACRFSGKGGACA